MYGIYSRRRKRRDAEYEGSGYPTASLEYEEEREYPVWQRLMRRMLKLPTTYIVSWRVECMAICSRENYGADADGNRGEMRTSIDEFEYSDYMKNGKGVAEKAVPAAVLAAFERMAADHEWNIG